MVGAERFELPTLWSQTRCASQAALRPENEFFLKLKSAQNILEPSSKSRCDEADGAVQESRSGVYLKNTLSSGSAVDCVRRPSQLEDFEQVLKEHLKNITKPTPVLLKTGGRK